MPPELRIFLSAVQFFTRIRVPARVGHSALQLGQAARYLPAVGLLVGLLAGAVLLLAAQILPVSIAAGLGIVAGILITGAFHEDGLSDFADGLGGHSKESMLAIMKDSRIGVYGVIALVLTLLLKYEALVALCGKRTAAYAAFALLAGHVVSRVIALTLMLNLRYVRTDASAKAAPAAQPLDRISLAVVLATGLLALCILFAAGATINALVAGVTMGLLVRTYLAWQLQKRLGGYTGDCLGAVQQLAEVAFYLGLLAAP